MQIRLIRATSSFVAFLLAIVFLMGNAALAEESLRISRPQRTGAPAASPEATAKQRTPLPHVSSTTCCESTFQSVVDIEAGRLKDPLPPEGLFARWFSEFVSQPNRLPVVYFPSISVGAPSFSGSAFMAAGKPLKSEMPCCDQSKQELALLLTSSLPPDGLYARWRAEFVNPTMCPILLCHGSCAGSTMSCKNIKTMIDSLLDAYIPEEPPIEAVLNFRCCAGFTED